MTIKEINQRIAKLKYTAVKDDATAHRDEDELREEFIWWLAKRKDIIGKKAQLVLTTDAIRFSRWYG
jgi:hypothetical protein